ncbi:RagB/SusD family nutrient uptake outer membrane protein [Pedobacter sp. BS3]|nr:RagB/SusD family nutrient uptake outer membrane protein [Pedobacter sp. BS3]TZF83145.1 RagB/SusD family nutrient uptake outer membrane protein [Pedobacter sp. BS3]
MYLPTNDGNQEYTLSPGAPGNISGVWTKCYKAITQANLVINRVGKAPIGAALKSRLIGECKYLRALHYYILSNSFGAVPLWTDELDVTVVSSLPRTPLADVRKQIKADLTDAAADLPTSYPATDVGRATRGAALALLAKVYLFDKDWANAQKYAQQVVDLNQYQLVNFANLFDINNGFKNNKESIFEIQFKRDNATNTNVKVNYYYTWFFPLKDSNNRTYAGVDFGSTVLRGYENFYPSAVFVNMFDNADKRKAVTLATGYNGQNFTRFIKPGRPWFGAKFWDLQANDRNSGKDIYFQRYADVLLILAEAENEQNNTTGALTWINKVRLEHGGLTTPLSGLTQADIRNVLFTERAIEFAGEFQRKWDLARWGKLVDAVRSVAADNPKGAANIKAEYALFPVPDAEIVKDPNLKPQNPGY